MKKIVAFIVLSVISQISASEIQILPDDVQKLIIDNLVNSNDLSSIMRYGLSNKTIPNKNIGIEALKKIISLLDIKFHKSPVTVALKLYPLIGVRILQALKEVTQDNDLIHPEMQKAINKLDIEAIRLRIKDMTAGYVLFSRPHHNGDELIKFVYSGADVSQLQHALESAIKWNNQSRIHLIKLLIAADANVNYVNHFNESILLMAIRKQQDAIEVVPLLLSAGADVNKKNDYGESPLTLAAQLDHLDLVKLLIPYHPDVNQSGYNPADVNQSRYTPLFFAIIHNNTEMAHLLITIGADINKPNGSYGYTPLMYAVMYIKKTMVKLLLAFEADIGTRNKLNHTADMIYQTEMTPNAELSPSQKEIMAMLQQARMEAERTHKPKKCTCTVS